MLWIISAFFTAVFESLKDGLCKKSVADLDYLYVAWAWKTFSVIFLLPYLYFFNLHFININFFIALVAGGGLNIVATLLYIKAIKCSDLSTTLPMLSFTPLFLLLTSPIMVGDIPDPSGFMGVFLIFLGSFILTKSMSSDGSLTEGRNSLKGPLYMLAVAFIWSLAANIDKIGIKNSSIFIWALSVQLFISIGLSSIIWAKKGAKDILYTSKNNLNSFVMIGLFTALGLNCQFFAISKGLVPYVISIKRLSIVFGVIMGGVFFKEKHIKVRLLACMIMFAGMVLIVV